MDGSRGRTVFHITILLCVVIMVFANSLFNGFVWDDTTLVQNITIYKTFDLRGVFLSLANGFEYLPVRDMSYLIDFALYGENPLGFHVSNVIIYGLNVVAVYFMASKLLIPKKLEGDVKINSQSSLVALATAGLFAVHPIHSEVVNFIIQRNALLSGLFFFSSCYFFLLFLDHAGWRRTACYLAALICCLLAFFSKATSIILPIILVLIAFYRGHKLRSREMLGILPFFVLAVPVFYLFSSIGRTVGIIQMERMVSGHQGVMANGIIALQIPIFYLQKLIVPSGLAVEYSVTFGDSLTSTSFLLCIFVYLCMTGTALLFRKRQPMILFCLLWFMITLIPVLHLFPTSTIVADRYAYLPSFAFFFLLASIGMECASKRCGSCAAIGGICLLSIWACISFRQNTFWRTEKILWERAVAVSPVSWRAQKNLGIIYFTEGSYQKAMNIFYKMQTINASDPTYDFFRGYQYFVRGDLDNAITLFKMSLDRDSGYIEALYHLGLAYEQNGDKELAVKIFRRLLSTKEPDDLKRRKSALERLNNIQP